MGKLECNMKGKELAYFGFIMDPIYRICRDPEEGGGVGGVVGNTCKSRERMSKPKCWPLTHKNRHN